MSIEKLTYEFCYECNQDDGTVDKQCTEPPVDILPGLKKANGNTTILPPDAQRYFEVTSDEFEGNCFVYAKINYEAFAAVQVFFESFTASVEVECTDEETGITANGEDTIEATPFLDEAFESYFQAEEDCIYADLDGCGGRDVVFAGVDTIKAGECVDVADPTSPDNPTKQGDIDPSRHLAKRKRRRSLRMKGRNRKRGRCRRKCASRNKKVSDVIYSSNVDNRGRLLLLEQTIQHRQARHVQCVGEDAEKPNLKRELLKRAEGIGFTPTRALITEVRELACSLESKACREGACCGTEGCSCNDSDFTAENCLAGTTKRGAEVIVPCFLSYDGNLAAENQCCEATSECLTYCQTLQ